MKTTRRIISTILAVCLLASLCCTAAFAADLRLNDGSIKWHQTGYVANDEDPADPNNSEDPADPNNSEDPANPNNSEDPANPNNSEDPANPDNPADPADNPADPSANPADPSANPEDPANPSPNPNSFSMVSDLNVYMPNLPEVGMKIEDASLGIYSCNGTVSVKSVKWLKAKAEGDPVADKYTAVTEETFGKEKYAIQLELECLKDYAIFYYSVNVTLNGMKCQNVDLKGSDLCVATFEFWELSDDVYLNVETVEPTIGGIASDKAFIANLNSDYYVDRNTVKWYRIDSGSNSGSVELIAGREFEEGKIYAIEFLLNKVESPADPANPARRANSENPEEPVDPVDPAVPVNPAEPTTEGKLHILLNGIDVDYTFTDDGMMKVYYAFSKLEKVEEDEQPKSAYQIAPAYKIMDSVTVGDLSGDKKVEMTDVVELQRIIAKLAKITNVADKFAADTNGDGRITMEDVTTMQKYIAKLIEKL